MGLLFNMRVSFPAFLEPIKVYAKVEYFFNSTHVCGTHVRKNLTIFRKNVYRDAVLLYDINPIPDISVLIKPKRLVKTGSFIVR